MTKLRDATTEIASTSPRDAVGKAYKQYALDERLDTDEDSSAFADAVYANIIDPLEEVLNVLLADVERRLDDAQADLDSAKQEFLTTLGL